MEKASELFFAKGIASVSVQEVADACGVGKVTLFRYFPSKMELVLAVGTWKWDEYIRKYQASVSHEVRERMTGEENLKFYLDSFLDLYRNHRDILCFNYEFNSYLRHETVTQENMRSYRYIIDVLGALFHAFYNRGMQDGTLNPGISEKAMFSGSFHIMLAAVTRYSIGLVCSLETGEDPESELLMLEKALLREYTNNNSAEK